MTKKTNIQLAGAAAALTGALLLAGCTATASPQPTSPGSTPTATATRIEFPALHSAGDVTSTCADIDTALPTWAVQPNLTPGPGTAAAAATSIGGVGCVLSDAAGDSLVVGVAKVTPDSISDLKSFLEANGSAPTTDFGTDGYFDKATGDAELIGGPFWVSASSDTFDSSAQANQVLTAILQTLPSG
ncbi:hypothetical protein [Subtercola endophyticus]|uniref:hypothetical protein n=1 Tax=Subtercola endophyticus TaxID=2895559 RepID=UPI001E52653D|nr:hypothetical protein [Subtercola endophyticus]UFS58171.1 hypothetical protein LQ955_14260 [Subtercola endophyticus]